MLTVNALARPGLGPVSFGVGDGECLAITGASGSGKSLLLRAITDLDANSGSVTAGKINRERVPATDWRKLVALLPAESGWWFDNVAAHFRTPDDTSPLLAAVGLPPDALTWEIARISSGERHRLALLRCLENRPRVLLLDEPTASLDQASTLLVEALLKQQLAQGVSVVIVTHDPAQPARIAHTVMKLENRQLTRVAA